jgi:hypothetical protein
MAVAGIKSAFVSISAHLVTKPKLIKPRHKSMIAQQQAALQIEAAHEAMEAAVWQQLQYYAVRTL